MLHPDRLDESVAALSKTDSRYKEYQAPFFQSAPPQSPRCRANGTEPLADQRREWASARECPLPQRPDRAQPHQGSARHWKSTEYVSDWQYRSGAITKNISPHGSGTQTQTQTRELG